MKKRTNIIIISLILILIFIIFFLSITWAMTININAKICDEYEKELANIKLSTENTQNGEENQNDKFKIMQTTKVSDFDLKFLKLENQKENKVYSPLSIKYGLKMLEEAAIGQSKTQISQLVGNFDLSLYSSNKNLSFANVLFIRDSYKSNIKESYINLLNDKYNAEIKFDIFENAENINNWINKKTYNNISNIIDDDSIGNLDLDFALINALAIDMEWEEKFIARRWSFNRILT